MDVWPELEQNLSTPDISKFIYTDSCLSPAALGNSAEMYYYGSQLWMNIIGVMIGTVFIMVVVMPVVYPLRLMTIYGVSEGCVVVVLVRVFVSLFSFLPSFLPWQGQNFFYPYCQKFT